VLRVEGPEGQLVPSPRGAPDDVGDAVRRQPARRLREKSAGDDDELGRLAGRRLGSGREEELGAATAEDEGGVDGAGRVKELERGRPAGQATSTGVGARRAQSMTSARIRSRSRLGRQPTAARILSIDGRRWSMSSIPWP